MASKEPVPTRWWIWAIVGLAAVGLVAFLFWHSSRPSVTVQAVQVAYKDITSITSTNGIVQPTLEYQAHATAPGQVQKLFVKVGDRVQKGQQLVEMDTTDAANRIATAQATLQGNELGLRNMQQGGTQDELLSEKGEINSARMAVEQDEQTLAVRQKLLATGAASPNEVQAAEQKLTQDKAHLAQLESRQTGRYSGGDMAAQRALVQQARTAVAAAQSDYAAADIRTPIAGTVYAVSVNQYDYVQTGALLLNVADLTRLQVRAYFDEPEVGKLSAGQAVTIEWAARPGKVWHGHILKAPTTITAYGTRNVGESIITVDDANGDLLPNTNVTVHVTTQTRPHVLSLPREALHTQGVRSYVYRVVDGRLVRTPIQVGLVNVVQFEIVSGLREGDLVALHATSEAELTDGLRVDVER